MTETNITYVELAGAHAREALARYGAHLAARGAPCELMASTARADLYLLVCQGAPSLDDAPEGARTWAFERLERFA